MAEDFNARVIREFRENDGRVGPPFQGATMVLLHHRGAKSGQERVSPLVYFRLDGRVVVVASKGGAPTHPAWFHNLKAHPRVTAELAASDGIDVVEVEATEITGAERDELFGRIVERAPGFGEYQRKIDGVRTIPLVELRPVA